MLAVSTKARLGIGLAAAAAGLLILLAVRKSPSPPDADFKGLPADLMAGPSTAAAAMEGTPAIITPDTSEDPTRLILPEGSQRSKESPPPPPGIVVTQADRDEVLTPPAAPPMEHVPLAARRERFRSYIEQLKALREALMGDFNRPVPIEGSTAKLLSKPPKASGPIADGESPDHWSGSYSGHHEAGTQVVSDLASWRVFWTKLTSEPMPQVDFSTRRVVAVFLGTRPSPGWSVDILDAVSSPKSVLVRYREVPPSPGARQPETPTSPYCLLAIPAGPQPVKFQKAN